ncbi:MAG: formate dehydrogenase subunit gamma [Pseudomonadota bacterium]
MGSLDSERQQQVDRIVASFAGQPGALLPILHAIQDLLGYIPPAAVPNIAEGLNLSRAEVHGVISFYHYFRQSPPGRHVLQICRAEACQAMHGERTEEHACARLGVDFGATTADQQFTLEAAYCLGNCAAAPSAMIDDRIYGRVTPERLDELLAEWRQR